MAGITLGFLRYVLGFDSLSFQKGISKADADLQSLQKKFARTGAKMANIGKTLSIGLTAPLAAFAAKGIREAQETAAAMAQVNASLASMGPVAGRTAAQLEKAANAFEGASLFEADQILKDVTATMLTFGNVTGATFDRAQQAAIDLATKFSKGLPEAAIMVGKALQDPIKGIAALTKVGVSFEPSQKAMIKSLVETGQAAKAQQVILAALEKQVEKSGAKAQGAAPMNRMADAMNSVAEPLGTILLPILEKAAVFLEKLALKFQALSPETKSWIVTLGGIAVVAGPALIVLGNLVGSVAKLAPLVSVLAKGFNLLRAGFMIARLAALQTLPALLPYLIPLGAIALAVGAVYLAWKNWDKIVAVVKMVYTAVKTWLMDKLGAIFNWVGDKLKWVADKFKWLRDVVVTHSYVPDMVEAIGQHMARLEKEMVAPVKAATSAAAQAFRDLQSSVKPLFDQLFPEQAKENRFLADMALLAEYAKAAKLPIEQLAEAQRRLTDQFFGEDSRGLSEGFDPGVLMGLNDNIDWSQFSVGTDQLAADAEEARNRVIQSFGDMAAGVIGSLRGMVDAFKSGDILGGIKGIIDVVGQVISALGQIGVIKLPSGGSYGGARAAGGPVSGGRSYLVGERGPELFQPGRSGRIVANDRMGGMSRVQIVPSAYFDVIVDGRAARVAAPMAGRAALTGAAAAGQARAVSDRRRFP